MADEQPTEPFLSGGVEFEVIIRFSVLDAVAMVKHFSKEWRELTPEQMRQEGWQHEWQRFDLFLGKVLEEAVDIDVHLPSIPGMRLSEDVLWNHQHWRWTEEDAAALMAMLPRDLQFVEGQPDYDPMKDMTPQPNDQPLPLDDAQGGDA